MLSLMPQDIHHLLMCQDSGEQSRVLLLTVNDQLMIYGVINGVFRYFGSCESRLSLEKSQVIFKK